MISLGDRDLGQSPLVRITRFIEDEERLAVAGHLEVARIHISALKGKRHHRWPDYIGLKPTFHPAAVGRCPGALQGIHPIVGVGRLERPRIGLGGAPDELRGVNAGSKVAQEIRGLESRAQHPVRDGRGTNRRRPREGNRPRVDCRAQCRGGAIEGIANGKPRLAGTERHGD